MTKITPNITVEAKKVYDNLPKAVNKSVWVSEAIIEKHSSKGEYITREEVQEMIFLYTKRMKEIIGFSNFNHNSTKPSLLQRIEQLEDIIKERGK